MDRTAQCINLMNSVRIGPIVGIHQPEFFPWMGFFDKMSRVDLFVILDHVQFKKRYFENRNRIRLSDRSVWITAPVISKGRYKQKISDVRLSDEGHWQNKLIQRIRYAYGKTPYFDIIFPDICQVVRKTESNRLMDLNIDIIRLFRKYFLIDTPMSCSSQMDIGNLSGSDLILGICVATGATTYLCGPSGKDYLDLDAFQSQHIQVSWQNFHHPEYEQYGSGFISHLSALDYLFNCGPGAFPHVKDQ